MLLRRRICVGLSSRRTEKQNVELKRKQNRLISKNVSTEHRWPSGAKNGLSFLIFNFKSDKKSSFQNHISIPLETGSAWDGRPLLYHFENTFFCKFPWNKHDWHRTAFLSVADGWNFFVWRSRWIAILGVTDFLANLPSNYYNIWYN